MIDGWIVDRGQSSKEESLLESNVGKRKTAWTFSDATRYSFQQPIRARFTLHHLFISISPRELHINDTIQSPYIHESHILYKPTSRRYIQSTSILLSHHPSNPIHRPLNPSLNLIPIRPSLRKLIHLLCLNKLLHRSSSAIISAISFACFPSIR